MRVTDLLPIKRNKQKRVRTVLLVLFCIYSFSEVVLTSSLLLCSSAEQGSASDFVSLLLESSE